MKTCSQVMLNLRACLLLELAAIILGDISRDKNAPLCLGVECKNGGTLDNDTCGCTCTEMMTGLFCEKELVASEWPNGPYGLPSTQYGCPETVLHGWKTGYVNLTISSELSPQGWSVHDNLVQENDLLGPYDEYHLQMNFCIKSVDKEQYIAWPAGSYCIYQVGEQCPEGFTSGSITMTGYRLSKFDVHGWLPRYSLKEENGTDSHQIQIFYCCRNDTQETARIMFGGGWPFILIQSDGECPSLPGMLLTDEYFNYTSGKTPWSHSGTHPQYTEAEYNNNTNVVINYCYYTPPENETWREEKRSNSTEGSRLLSKDKPVISSPGGTINPKATYDGITGPAYIYPPFNTGDNPCWVQVDMQYLHKVVRVELVGSVSAILISRFQWDFLHNGAILCRAPDPSVRDETVNLVQSLSCRRPTEVQYVIVYRKVDINEWMILGDERKISGYHEIDIIVEGNICSKPLGLVSGAIHDYQVHSTSEWTVSKPDGKMCVGPTDGTAYVVIDLIVPTALHGLLIRGFDNSLSSFSLHYAVSDENYTMYTDPSGKQIFGLNENESNYTQVVLSTEVLATFVAITLVEYSQDPCFKLELIGCPRQVFRDFRCGSTSHYLGLATTWNVLATILTDKLVVKTLLFVTLEACNTAFLNRTDCLSVSWMSSQCHLLMIQQHTFTSQLLFRHEGATYSEKICIKHVQEDDACEYVVSKPGVVESPMYHLYYGEDRECVWHIKFPTTKTIRLEVLEILLPEKEILENGECEDQVFLTNALDANRTHNGIEMLKLDKYKHLRSVLYSSTNELYISLRSCHHYKTIGIARFAIKVSEADFVGCGFFNTSANSTCTAQYGKLSSPFYPAFYYLKSGLSWTITAAPNQYIQLLFSDMDIPSDSKCLLSHVAVYDIRTTTSSSQLIGKYCSDNQKHGPIRSSWNALRITMVLHGNTTGIGFIAEYELKSGIFKMKENRTDTVNECSAGWVAWNGNCYKYVNHSSSQTWTTAEKLCNKESSHLLSIENRDEMQFIHNLLISEWDNISPVIIGLYKHNDYGSINDYKWTDGKVATYFDWAFNSVKKEPDGSSNERCTIIKPSSLWQTQSWLDYMCAYGDYNSFICKTSTKTEAVQATTNRVDSAKNRMDWWFICKYGSVISTVYTCDGIKDCSDASDEMKCDDNQHSNMFQCSTGKYIHLSMYCDHIPDCLDSEDEKQCVYRNCSEDEWRCANHQCIPKHKKCDFKVDCADKSDESNCATCENGGFQCYDQKCIPLTRQDDGIVDCSGEHHEDEKDIILQPVQPTCEAWYRLGARQNGKYLVNYGGQESFHVECIFPKGEGGKVTVRVNHNLQGRKHIPESYVKIEYSATLQQIRRLTSMRTCEQLITRECALIDMGFDYSLRWENSIVIETWDFGRYYPDNRTIPCDKSYKFLSTKPPYYIMSSKLYTSLHGIPILEIKKHTAQHSNIVKKFSMSVDVSPVNCKEEIQNTTQTHFLCKNGFITDIRSRCTLKLDENGEVEGCRDMSHLEDCYDFECQENYLKCPDSFCIPRYLFCDGVKHCPNGADEMNCGNIDCSGLFKCHNSSVCIPFDEVCDGRKHCTHGDDESLCDVVCPYNCTCDGLAFACPRFPNFTDVSNRIRKLSISTTQSPPNKPSLSQFPYLAELLIIQSNLNTLGNNTFKALKNLRLLDLSKNLVETLDDLTFNGLQNLLYLNISENKISKILPGTFHGLNKLISLDLRDNGIETMNKGLFDGLSALEYLYTDEYRFCCIKPITVTRENCLPSEDEFSSCEDLMKNELMRISLWTIGSAALLGNGVSVVYRLGFDRGMLEKPHGIFVLNLCIADFLMGVYLFIIASADEYYRGRYIYSEDFWRHSVGCQVAGLLATLSSEASTTILCFITLDRLLAIKYPFSTAKFNPLRAKMSVAFIWLFTLCISIIPLTGIPYFQSEFYSRSGTCLALPLTRDRRGGWLYSVIVFLGYNFVAFSAIVIGQILIYAEIRAAASASIRKTGVQDRNIVIARNLFLIVFTDFLCWFPIALMGLAAIFGQPVPGEMYAWTTIFILPINSALNPILYTLKAYRQRKKTGRHRTQITELTTEIERLKSVKATSVNKQNEELYDLRNDNENKSRRIEQLERQISELQDNTYDTAL